MSGTHAPAQALRAHTRRTAWRGAAWRGVKGSRVRAMATMRLLCSNVRVRARVRAAPRHDIAQTQAYDALVDADLPIAEAEMTRDACSKQLSRSPQVGYL